jgi:hypothetical protein
MTINALMLSLGPSLNMPGNVFSELISRREELFASPPQPSPVGEMAGLIDFGDTKLEPIEIPASEPTPVSARSMTPISDIGSTVEKPRRSPLLASKPSMTRLFGMSSSSARRGSTDTTATTVSSVGLAPPRVEVDTDTPRLPSFDSDDPRTSFEFPSSVISEKPLPLEPIISTSSSTQDVQYQAGTVEDRKRTFSNASSSTPIADMYAGQSKFPSLRPQRSTQNMNGMTQSTSSPVIGLTGMDAFASMSAPARPSAKDGSGDASQNGNAGTKSASAPANPATVIRRGQPGFFGSGDRSERHVRSHSLASTNSRSKGAGLMGPPVLPPRPTAEGDEKRLSGAAEKVEMMA